MNSPATVRLTRSHPFQALHQAGPAGAPRPLLPAVLLASMLLSACGGGAGVVAEVIGSASGRLSSDVAAAQAAAARQPASAAQLMPSGTVTSPAGALITAPAGAVSATGATAAPLAASAAAVTPAYAAASSGNNASVLSGVVSVATPSAPSAQPPLAECGLSDHIDLILQRINALRASGASCGARGVFAPAAALVWNTKLFAAAAGHSADMATHDYFSHVSPAGLTLIDRVVAVDYIYSLAGENIAAGQSSLDAVLGSWMASDGHCANLLHPQMREVALACDRATTARYASYWTLNLGASR
jgi:uncharacterized protein YkwD